MNINVNLNNHVGKFFNLTGFYLKKNVYMYTCDIFVKYMYKMYGTCMYMYKVYGTCMYM